MNATQLVDLSCLSILFGTWLRLTMKAATVNIHTMGQVFAILALVLMTVSAGLLIFDVFTRSYQPTESDLALHGSLALWNGLILFGVIRGTNHAITRPVV